MALSHGAPARILAPWNTLNELRIRCQSAAACAAAIALLVGAPWLWARGYLFGTDFPGPRRFDWPATITSTVPVEASLATASRLIGAEWTGKFLYIAILLAAAIAAFAAVPARDFIPRAIGATLYVFNPFVFGRLHYGQLFLVAGYALLPWVAFSVRELCRKPSVRRGVATAVATSLVGAFTVHLFLVSWILIVVAFLGYILAAPDRLGYGRQLLARGAVTAGVSALLSSYWAIPFVLGRGVEAGVIRATGTAELNAYAAVPDQQLGLLPNLLGLYGFWAESSHRFTLMKAFVPFWPAALAILLVLAAVGVVSGLRDRENRLGPWVAGLVVLAAVAIVLEMGVSHPLTAGLVRWLDSTLPLYRGMRDAGKWAAALALVYSQLGGMGTAAVLRWIRGLSIRPADWIGSAAAGALLALAIYYGNGLLFGMHGEVQPSQYPAGWYAADRQLLADPHPGRVLFLPWHEYLSYSFIKNQNNVVACPAPAFFSVPILASANPEVPGVAPPAGADQVAVAGLVASGKSGRWAAVLAALGVKYVLLAKEVDWKSYQFLNSQQGLTLVADYGSIELYRNDGLP